MVNTNFPLPPFQRSVVWERRGGEGGGQGKKKLLCKWTPLPPSWVVMLMILSVLAKKQKLKIDCNFQFSIFLNHTTDCNMVRKVKLPLSFIFLFIVDRIKVKKRLCFNILSKEKKVKNFGSGTFVFL